MRFDFALLGIGRMVRPMSGLLSYQPYALPFRVPLRTAHGRWDERQGFWLKWETEAGVRHGEAAPIPGFGGASLTELAAELRQLGESPSASEWQQVIDRGGELAFALGSLRCDWQALLAEGPDYVPVAGLLPAGKAAFARAEPLLEMGFRTFKWKVGVADPRDEQGMLDELLSRMPERVQLRLDANGGWDRRTAERWLSLAAERPQIEFIEQPCAADAVDLLMGLAQDFPVTLALDEAVLGAEDFGRWQDLGWPGVYVLKPALWGDPIDLIARVRAAKADVVISSALETRVGARIVMAIAFALAGSARAAGLGVWPLFVEGTHDAPTALPFFQRETVLSLDAAVGEGIA